MRKIMIAFLVVFLIPVAVLAAPCVPDMDFSYVESAVTTGPFSGKWQYDFTLTNNSSTIGDCIGYDIYYFEFSYAGSRDFLDGTLPTGWDDGGTNLSIWEEGLGNTAIAYSTNPGIPPSGYDVSPGSSLTGFSFKTTYKYGELPDPELWVTEVYLNDPTNTNGDPIIITKTFLPASVPEPATLILLGAGLAVLGIYGRNKKK